MLELDESELFEQGRNVHREPASVALAESVPAAGGVARVNLRLKLLPPEIDRFSGEFFRSADGMLAAVRRSKWGFTLPEAKSRVRDFLEGRAAKVQRSETTA